MVSFDDVAAIWSVRLGTINTNTFRTTTPCWGSLCHVDERVRA